MFVIDFIYLIRPYFVLAFSLRQLACFVLLCDCSLMKLCWPQTS